MVLPNFPWFLYFVPLIFSLIVFGTLFLKFYNFVKVKDSRPEVFCKKGVLWNFSKFTGKHLYQSLFFNRVAGLRAVTSLKKRLWHRCFPISFAKFLKTPFLQNTSRRLLLYGTSRFFAILTLQTLLYKNMSTFHFFHLKYFPFFFYLITLSHFFPRLISKFHIWRKLYLKW